MLNVSKTKELIVDFRRTQQHQRTYTSLGINGTAEERVSSFRYLGVHITEVLTWTTHIETLVRKAKQRLYHLRELRMVRSAERTIGTTLPTLQDLYSRRCQTRACSISCVCPEYLLCTSCICPKDFLCTSCFSYLEAVLPGAG